MNYWCLFLCGIVAACSQTSYDYEHHMSTELDAGNDGSFVMTAPAAKTSTDQSSRLVREFEVDLFNEDPLQKESVVHISDQDTFKISLLTLDLLTEEKRFPLIEAEKIVHTGMPNIISPKGYSVKLEIVDNQVIAVMKSTTAPDSPPKIVRVDPGNNDIVVGDLGQAELLAASIHQSLALNTLSTGISRAAFGNNVYEYAGYATDNQWGVQLCRSRVASKTILRGSIEKKWHLSSYGDVSLAFQSLYRIQDSQKAQAILLKYSFPIDIPGMHTHFISAVTLGSSIVPALGGGVSYQFSNSGVLNFNWVAAKPAWDAGIEFKLTF